MHLWPAIDIRDGRAVRLLRGDFAHETMFGDPVSVALGYRDAGARRLHLVDLDAARSGEPVNRAVIGDIVRAVGPEVGVQVGGGVRDRESAEALFRLGVLRVVMGTVAVEDPDAVRAVAADWPGRVVAGLDYRRAQGRQEVAVRGWTEGSGRGLVEAVAALEDSGLGGVVVTDISRDGTGDGPDAAGLAELLGLTRLAVVASGGVAGAQDLRALCDVAAGERRLDGVVVGKALLSGAMTLPAALAACGDST
jgi:phosphoribosylformimino-5-aminoimidazole carboxamide ribotide isomerase